MEARVAQLVEHDLPKVGVAGSNPGLSLNEKTQKIKTYNTNI